jgi:hypothetical protein
MDLGGGSERPRSSGHGVGLLNAVLAGVMESNSPIEQRSRGDLCFSPLGRRGKRPYL